MLENHGLQAASFGAACYISENFIAERTFAFFVSSYEIKFESDGDCTWYQDGQFFEGSYYWDKDDEVYYLDIKGSGFYSNTTFEAEPDGKDLIVTGGVVKGEVFSK